ncbi:protein of unknown function [Robiginitalea myxolifaciens]|uniref:DUF4249 domain-containing protein n=1 Tax=Robiginitalea myxolifaciens TaxID=400055 RepID=A0A1I6H5C8_9FLAO|nr:protein of unknown function [Robiginitalea myxolifaciens]
MFLSVSLLFAACEDVVEVEVTDSPPRLLVEGLLRVDEQQAFIPVRIQLKETAGFFEELTPTQAENIFIQVERFEDGQLIESFSSLLAEESPGTGLYVPDPNAFGDQRIPTVFLNAEVRFTLNILHKGRNYVAQTWYQPVVPIDFVLQGRNTLFEGDETEVIITFSDPGTTDDFYLFQFDPGEYLVTEDQFYQGQLFQFSYFYEDPIPEGTLKTIRIMGASAEFYNYMDLLIEQSELEGPFQVPAATVRGNVLDVTDIDNLERSNNADRPEVFPLGYFAVVQQYEEELIIR